jgi:hypothetical protein
MHLGARGAKMSTLTRNSAPACSSSRRTYATEDGSSGHDLLHQTSISNEWFERVSNLLISVSKLVCPSARILVTRPIRFAIVT